MNADTLPVVDDVVVTVINGVKPRYVCGFEIGDLVETRRPLAPFSDGGPYVPQYSVGMITARTTNTARIVTLFWGVLWVDLDDLVFALPVIPAPVRLAEIKEGDATR